MSKFDAAYTNKLYGLGETVDHDEAIEHDLRSHLEGYLKWRPIDEEDTPERYFDAFVSMLGRVKPELAAVADGSEFLWSAIEDKIAEAGMSPKIESIDDDAGLQPADKVLARGPLWDITGKALEEGDIVEHIR